MNYSRGEELHHQPVAVESGAQLQLNCLLFVLFVGRTRVGNPNWFAPNATRRPNFFCPIRFFLGWRFILELN